MFLCLHIPDQVGDAVITGPVGAVITGPVGAVITGPVGAVIAGPVGDVITGPVGAVIACLTGNLWEQRCYDSRQLVVFQQEAVVAEL